PDPYRVPSAAVATMPGTRPGLGTNPPSSEPEHQSLGFASESGDRFSAPLQRRRRITLAGLELLDGLFDQARHRDGEVQLVGLLLGDGQVLLRPRDGPGVGPL